jgi:hypothetical protein
MFGALRETQTTLYSPLATSDILSIVLRDIDFGIYAHQVAKEIMWGGSDPTIVIYDPKTNGCKLWGKLDERFNTLSNGEPKHIIKKLPLNEWLAMTGRRLSHEARVEILEVEQEHMQNWIHLLDTHVYKLLEPDTKPTPEGKSSLQKHKEKLLLLKRQRTFEY